MIFELRDEEVKQKLLSKIDSNDRRMYWTKVKTLMSEFGFQATSRVRSSSLSEVLDKLKEWGLDYDRNSSFRADDYITIRRADASTLAQRAKSTAPPAHKDVAFVPSFEPLHFAFRVGAEKDGERSKANAHDVTTAIWAFRPICLFVNASDELFSFIGGFLAAMMRRRALMARSTWNSAETLPLGPQILSINKLKQAVGLSDELGERIPTFGSVYLVRDDANDTRDDELTAALRELSVPHTYRLEGRFVGREAIDADFAAFADWLAAFAGARHLSAGLRPELTDLATLFADAAQAQELLVDRATLGATDPAFRSGFESTEHMALKSVLLQHLRDAGHDVLVEETLEYVDENAIDPELLEATTSRTHRPDLRVKGKLWVEVETLRGLSVRGGNPFFALEAKMRRRLDAMKGETEGWLIVPSDVATLAHRQLDAIVRNLAAAKSMKNLRWGFVDLVSREPVFVDSRGHDGPLAEIQIRGVSWREASRVDPKQKKVTWSDVAGYSDLRQRLTEDVLQPLIDPERYLGCGLTNANGLLLFGLPGCGKSLVGKVLAGVADMTCRLLVPSDLSSMWLGETTAKIRETFDWALKQRSCLIVLDEIDAVAPQRSEHNMHTDEKRSVNELLAQLDRISGRPIMVVGTTNYMRGIDTAVRRCGRFDVKIPVFPPDAADRGSIFEHYLRSRLKNVDGLENLNVDDLAARTPLYTPADIKTVVETTARRAVHRAPSGSRPLLTMDTILEVLSRHQRAIQCGTATTWLEEATSELGTHDGGQLGWLRGEIKLAYGA